MRNIDVAKLIEFRRHDNAFGEGAVTLERALGRDNTLTKGNQMPPRTKDYHIHDSHRTYRDAIKVLEAERDNYLIDAEEAQQKYEYTFDPRRAFIEQGARDRALLLDVAATYLRAAAGLLPVPKHGPEAAPGAKPKDYILRCNRPQKGRRRIGLMEADLGASFPSSISTYNRGIRRILIEWEAAVGEEYDNALKEAQALADHLNAGGKWEGLRHRVTASVSWFWGRRSSVLEPVGDPDA